jgi:xanthine dehydrogenase YagR molybdenum-binding subunit
MRTENYIGKATSRVDGFAKVTGEAKYAAEYHTEGMTHGVVVSGAIARGEIKAIETSEALKLPGVLHVFTHENRPSLPWFDRSYQDEDQPPGSPFRPLYDNKIQFNMQPVALVVAETFELANYAASLVKITYSQKEHDTDFKGNLSSAFTARKGKSGWEPPVSRGNASAAFKKASVQIEAEYYHPAEHHNPMEMHASTVVYEASGNLTVYDKTQGVQNSQQYISKIFNLSTAQARVISPYVGGAFGSGLRPQYQLFLAVMAALELKRSVRVTLTRQQMFSFGHRPATLQRFSLGASASGTLEAVVHEALSETSKYETYTENVVNWSGMLYQCANTELLYKLVPLDCYTPLDMRAPGGATGVFAFEAAIDELAYAAGVDPLEFRLKNYAEREQNEDLPFSSKELRECYLQGAERFGWDKRAELHTKSPRGNDLVGWGMATGVWEAQQQPAMAKAILSADGKLTVSSATSDIGTGTYTIMTQIAAEVLGIPLADVTFQLGDSTLSKAPLQGGSWTASSVGPAVAAVCVALKEQLYAIAQKMEGSFLKKAPLDDLQFSEGFISLSADPSQRVSISDVIKSGKEATLIAEVATKPDAQSKKYAMYTHSAAFVEVTVDKDLGTVHVTRVVIAVAGGKVLNPKTARSQILGGVVWGIGMALEEESLMDNHYGRFINHDLAEYHLPVNADIQDIDVIFVDEEDTIVNPLGVKGLGEIGIVGIPAAICNAIFHATGKRVRDLPITLDKLL